MDTSPTTPTPPAGGPLRLWPGIAAALLVVLLRFVVPVFSSDAMGVGLIGAAAGALVIVLWWLFFSRAPWSERIGAIAVMVVAALATRPFLHASIVGGMMGMMFAVYALPPVLGPALVGWAATSRRLGPAARWASLLAVMLAGCAVWTLFRTDGLGGSGAQLAWRWTPTAEERLLARGDDTPKPIAPGPAETAAAPSANAASSAATAPDNPAVASGTAKPEAGNIAGAPASSAPSEASTASERSPGRVEWAGFRGTQRDAVVRGLRIETNWAARAPVEMWRRPIGPGWSSFAVQGDVLFTQEQRGQRRSCQRTGSAPVNPCGATAIRRVSGSRTPAPVRERRRR